MSDEILSYDCIQELNLEKKHKLIEFNSKHFTLFAGFGVLILLFSPFGANAKEFVLEKGKLLINNDDFFLEGERKIKKLYKEVDYRKVKNTQKIIDTSIVSSKTLSTSTNHFLEVNLSLPPIDVLQVWESFFTKIKTSKKTPTVSSTPQLLNQKLFTIRAGVLGYAIGRIGEKLAGKVLGKAGEKLNGWIDSENSTNTKNNQQNQVWNSVLQFFQKNPVLFVGVTIWAFLNRKKNNEVIVDTIRGTFPPVLSDVIVGKQRTIKNLAMTILSPKKPYLYFTVAGILFIVYRPQFMRFFRREINVSEVISEITRSFLKTNSELFNKFSDVVRDFTQNTVKNENRSFEAGQKANKEKEEILLKNINECKAEKFDVSEELKAKVESLNNCQNTYNILSTHTDAFIFDISREEALKTLEYEVRKKLNPTDSKYLLTGTQLIEKDDYKKRFEEIFLEVSNKNNKMLQEKLVFKTFEKKKS